MKKLIACAALLVTGCVTSTPYQPLGVTGGYTELPLSADTYQIRFNGNGMTSAPRAQQMALVRAAELTLLKGYDRFLIIDNQEWTQQSQFTTPAQATTTINSSTYGNYGTATANTTVSGGDTMTINKPRANLVVRFLEPGDPGYGKALRAKSVLAEVGPQVGYSPSN